MIPLADFSQRNFIKKEVFLCAKKLAVMTDHVHAQTQTVKITVNVVHVLHITEMW